MSENYVNCYNLQLLETSHRKVRHMEVKLQNEQKQSKGRIQQEEETVMALREESRQKDEQMMKMRRALKEVNPNVIIVKELNNFPILTLFRGDCRNKKQTKIIVRLPVLDFIIFIYTHPQN